MGKALAQQRGEADPVKTPSTIRLTGSALMYNIPRWDKDDYSFRGTIKQVTLFSDFFGQNGWVVRTTVLRQSICDPEDFDLDIIVTGLVWEGDMPPDVGQDMEGSLWLQGSPRESL